MTNEITIEEAIELLKDKRMEINYKVNGTTQFSEALDMAIKALEQQPCDDCVSREAIKEKKVYSEERHEYVIPVAEIDWLPSVTPQPKRGEWIRQDDKSKRRYSWLYCSECGAWIGDKTKFCSECGAEMEGEDETNS